MGSRVIDSISLLKFLKGHNSIKSAGGVAFLAFKHCLMVLHISTMFPENISKGFRVIEGT